MSGKANNQKQLTLENMPAGLQNYPPLQRLIELYGPQQQMQTQAQIQQSVAPQYQQRNPLMGMDENYQRGLLNLQNAQRTAPWAQNME